MTLLDGKNFSIGLGLLVAEAARAIDAGNASDEAIVDRLRASNDARFYIGLKGNQEILK